MIDVDYYNKNYPLVVKYKLRNGNVLYDACKCSWGNTHGIYNVRCDPIEYVKLEIRYHRENNLYMNLQLMERDEESGKIVFPPWKMIKTNPYDIIMFKLVNHPQHVHDHPDWDWPEETDYYPTI